MKINFTPPKASFFDANFLVSVAVATEKHHYKAKLLFAKLVHYGWTGYCNSLVFNEAFYTCIRIDYKVKTGLDWKASTLKHDPLVVSRHIATAKVFWSSLRPFIVKDRLLLVDCSVDQVDDVMDIMQRYSLAPADAFHLAHARAACSDGSSVTIVSGDSDFNRVTTTPLTIINYRTVAV